MKRFAESLRRVREQLDLPEPARSRILLEIAADLEDSYQVFLRQGLEPQQARRRAEEAFSTSAESLEQLARLHRAGQQPVGERLSSQLASLWQKTLLLVLVAFELVLAVRILLDERFFLFLSPFLWPIAGLALTAFGVTLWKLAQLFSRRRIEARRLREGVGTLLFFSGASLAVAVCGLLFHLQRFFRASAGSPEDLFRNFAGWAATFASLMTVGLWTAFFAAFAWFVLSGLVARAERRELESLMISES